VNLIQRKPFGLLATLLVALVTFLASCSNYDRLVEKDQAAQKAWANIEAQLQRRADLIPNLVETVKAAAKHEKETFDDVAEARAKATSIQVTPEMLEDPAAMEKFAAAQQELSKSLGRLLATAEAYPELKAGDRFRDLQVQLEGTENRIAHAREEYNSAASEFNAELQKVRGQVVNKLTGKPFQPKALYKAEASAHVAPKVSF
jgi:LemA protein